MLEVYVRRDRKEGTRKQEQADTHRSATEGQGTTPRAGRSAALAHLGAVVSLSLKHTNKASREKGDFSGHRETKG